MEKIGNYFIERAAFGPHEQVTFRHAERDCFISVIPGLGGIVNRLRLWTEKGSLDVLDGYADYDDYQANKHLYKSAWLFPFPNRVAGGKYTHEGRAYQLPINEPALGNAIHGLVYDRGFELRHSTAEYGTVLKLTLRIDSTRLDVREYYPFDFQLEIGIYIEAFAFVGTEYKVTSKTVSKVDTSIPFGIGWHPYFKVDAESIDDISLKFPRVQRVELGTNNIPTGKIEDWGKFVSSEKIGGAELDHCFSVSGDQSVTTELAGQRFSLTIGQSPEEGAKYLQVYTPPARKSIAVEPMTSTVDAFNNKGGLMYLSSDRAAVSAELAWLSLSSSS